MDDDDDNIDDDGVGSDDDDDDDDDAGGGGGGGSGDKSNSQEIEINSSLTEHGSDTDHICWHIHRKGAVTNTNSISQNVNRVHSFIKLKPTQVAKQMVR